ncbi:MAG: hypothetical protein KJP21_01400 [Bacteroidia bacterium]|nr:hypothetical protein [Bacteroidia bacterium]NNJ55891.1 hypothetical protein [Bacteroidia bacterium]
MKNRVQKILAISVIALVAVLIIAKLVSNYQAGKIKWEDGDREAMVNTCLDDLGGYAVRFPRQSTEYCSCTTDTIMEHFTKAEYFLIESKPKAEKSEDLLPVILECYNDYQGAMFDASSID